MTEGANAYANSPVFRFYVRYWSHRAVMDRSEPASIGTPKCAGCRGLRSPSRFSRWTAPRFSGTIVPPAME